LWAGLGIRF